MWDWSPRGSVSSLRWGHCCSELLLFYLRSWFIASSRICVLVIGHSTCCGGGGQYNITQSDTTTQQILDRCLRLWHRERSLSEKCRVPSAGQNVLLVILCTSAVGGKALAFLKGFFFFLIEDSDLAQNTT